MQAYRMNRRKFLAGLGGTAAWPSAAFAQQPSRPPVIGFLNSASPRAFTHLVAAFREGLEAQGFPEGRVHFEYRWAEGQYQKLPAMAADLVQRQVSLIAATGGVVSAQAAKGSTSAVPIVFVVGFDPVQLGLVDSLSKPGGNATGVSVFTTELAEKRLELLHNLLPTVQNAAILINPSSVAVSIEVNESIAAAEKVGLRLQVIEATSEGHIETAIRDAAQRTGALLVSADPFFTSRREQIVALAARHALPMMYPFRSYTDAGGLVSYGTELTWAYQQVGTYAGRILRGARPSELPVQRPTRFDFILNLKTAKALGITVSPWLLVQAHEVIE